MNPVKLVHFLEPLDCFGQQTSLLDHFIPLLAQLLLDLSDKILGKVEFPHPVEQKILLVVGTESQLK